MRNSRAAAPLAGCGLALAAVLASGATALAEGTATTSGSQTFTAEAVAEFVRDAAPVCAAQPAADCVAIGWSFADRDGDGAIGLDEANALRDGVQTWFLGARDALPKRTTTGVAVSLLALQVVGTDTVHGNYDEDGDGRVTRAEALADITLDDRPLPVLLRDRDAVDWDSLLGRLGAGGLVLGDVIPEAGSLQ